MISNNSEVRAFSHSPESLKDIERDGISLSLTESISSPSVGREREEVGPGNPSGSWFPSYWQARNLRVRDFHVFHYPLYIFLSLFLQISLFYLSFPYYSATLFCLSFNFPIFSIKRDRGEVDAVSSILCLIGFPFLPRERFRTISFSSRNFLSYFFPIRRRTPYTNRQPGCITRIKSKFYPSWIIFLELSFSLQKLFETSPARYRSTKSSTIDSYIPFPFLSSSPPPKSNENIFVIPFIPLAQTPPPQNLWRIWKPTLSPHPPLSEKEISKEPRLCSPQKFVSITRTTAIDKPDRRLSPLLPDSRTSCPLL